MVERTRVVFDIVPEDPADNHVLACALAAKASFLVTGDQHLQSKRESVRVRICTAAELVAPLGEKR